MLKNLYELLLTIFTGLLALFTYRLWKATANLYKVSQEQSRDMKTSLSITQESASAAKKGAEVAEKALHVAERAYLRIENFEVRQFNIGNHINVHYEIHNVGHTPAQIIESLTIVDIVERDSFTTPVYDVDKGITGPKHSFIQPGEKASMIGISKNPVTPEQYQAVQYDDKLIFVWGKITFCDVFDKIWINGFGTAFSQTFGITTMDGYNYTKEYKPETH
jgi:hypothetical protein